MARTTAYFLHVTSCKCITLLRFPKGNIGHADGCHMTFPASLMCTASRVFPASGLLRPAPRPNSGCPDFRRPDFRNFGSPEVRMSWKPEHRISVFPEFREQEFRNSWFPDPGSRIPEFRNSRYSDSGSPKFRKFGHPNIRITDTDFMFPELCM